MRVQFSPANLLAENHNFGLTMKTIFDDAMRGVVYFGLDSYASVSKLEWDLNFQELRNVPLWIIQYTIDFHLNFEGDPVKAFNEVLSIKNKEKELVEENKRKEQDKLVKKVRIKGERVELRHGIKQFQQDSHRSPHLASLFAGEENKNYEVQTGTE